MWHIKRLETRLIVWITALSLIQALLFALLGQHLLEKSVREEVGKKALALASSIAELDEVQNALAYGDTQGLQDFIEKLRRSTGADFIVVGNTRRIRLTHPDPARIGSLMVGGDSREALDGRSYISEAKGSLGYSLRGKVPVRDAQGKVVGLVSVGFLATSVNSLISAKLATLVAAVAGLLVLGVLASLWIARRVKGALYGLQPEEIGRLYAEQNAILNTVRTGILALDNHGVVRKLNRRAKDLLGLPDRQPGQPRRHIQMLLPEQAEFLLKDPELTLNGVELFANERWLVLSRLPLKVKDQTDGVLISFRPVDEIEELSQQLAKVQAFSELLRVQTHDYSNKLNTLGALIQMGAYQKAVEFIGLESQGYQEQVNQLIEHIQEPMVVGLLLGKYHKARELGVEMTVEPDSLMQAVGETVLVEKLLSILGNLIDNAIEAAVKTRARPPRILVMLDDVGNNIIFDVEDSGCGISDDQFASLCSPEYSSKDGRQHGVGLYLVQTYIQALGGSLELGQSILGGARFSVYLPKTPTQEEPR
ncbi:ATP-binding protein [Gallaecimonas pentaromativorans]|uniref:ATP-binding protein n=1 Tax=Gallaecimonas pentaromativorans TaxID=584787 RepID=UPI003A95C62A